MGMKFWEHIPNSLRNKNLKMHIPNLLEKLVFFASKTLQSTLGTREKTFSFNFECYDLANAKE
jgi:hypothetical protein